jgi:hypothetical protein
MWQQHNERMAGLSVGARSIIVVMWKASDKSGLYAVFLVIIVLLPYL